MKEEQAKTGKKTRYAFEEKIKGKSNLNFIEVETVTEDVDEKKDFEYYEKLLADYERDMKEI